MTMITSIEFDVHCGPVRNGEQIDERMFPPIPTAGAVIAIVELALDQ